MIELIITLLQNILLILAGITAGATFGFKQKYPELSWADCARLTVEMLTSWTHR